MKEILRDAIFILIAFGLLTFADIVVVSWIIASLTVTYGIPWDTLNMAIIFWKRVLVWHVALIPLVIGFYTLLAVAGKNWRLAPSGILLFFGGGEDIVYFLAQLQAVPEKLPWLNEAILIAWTRFFTGTAEVTQAGVWLAAVISGLAALLILMLRVKSKPFAKGVV